MSEKEKQAQNIKKRSRYQQRVKNKKFDRLLNYLIGLVVVLIGLSLFVIFSTEPEQSDNKANQTDETDSVEENKHAEEDNGTGQEEEESSSSEQNESQRKQEENEPSSLVDGVEVERVEDGVVVERWTSEEWEPYPTKQVGPHASVYQKGHIDYEEKLSSIYSVIPLERENSILLKIQNNGSAQTSRAIVTNIEKTEIYRVFIEWVDKEGWKPMMVEVLDSLESVE